MISPFVAELILKTPKLTESLAHENYERCAKMLFKFADFCVGDTLILIVGPPHVGKTQLLALLAEYLLEKIFPDRRQNTCPVIGAKAQTSKEGKTTPKFIYQELLADLGNPLFDFQKMAETPNYRPSTRIDETFLLRSLSNGLRMTGVKMALLDEGQFLVRATDEDFRSALIESLKSLISSQMSVVIAGGYELADVVLSYRAHIAATTIVVHLERYRASEKDRKVWLTIIKSFSQSTKLEFENDTLLLEHADALLEQCHGSSGILEKRLIECAMVAAANDSKITAEVLRATAPVQEAWETLRNDIESGEHVVRRYEEEEREAKRSQIDASKVVAKKLKSKPFVRKPRRTYKRLRT